MNQVIAAPGRQRMVEILSGRNAEELAGQEVNLRKTGQDSYNFLGKIGSFWAEHKVERLNSSRGGTARTKWTQVVRAIILLEHIGTPDAIAILDRMAQGHPEAQPTRVAKESLKKLGGH